MNILVGFRGRRKRTLLDLEAKIPVLGRRRTGNFRLEAMDRSSFAAVTERDVTWSII